MATWWCKACARQIPQSEIQLGLDGKMVHTACPSARNAPPPGATSDGPRALARTGRILTILSGLVIGMVTGNFAGHATGSALLGAAVGTLLGAILAARNPGAAAPVERKCPYCLKTILATVRVCRHCHREVVPLSAKPAPRPTPRPS